MTYIPVNVVFGGAALSADINQIQENTTHCIREKNTTDLIFARIEKTINLATGVNNFTDLISFSTDAVDGDPAFSSTPTVMGLSIRLATGVGAPVSLKWQELTSTQIRIVCDFIGFSTVGTGNTATIHLTLVGK